MRRLGQGRSAEVFLDCDSRGRTFVRKIFISRGASNLVLHVLTGSTNPYTWCESAIRSAFGRRLILARLVPYWFGHKLRLPRALGWQWNRERGAYELLLEYIEGTHAPLRCPDLGSRGPDLLRVLTQEIMKPLQQRLIEAGFDGLLWQVGYGNPVAASNFMLERAEDTSLRWVWIDLESGVPALFALNPLTTFRFYLPKSFRYGRWLFDDVDIRRLEEYLGEHRSSIEAALGQRAFADLEHDVAELAHDQAAWKSIRRRGRCLRGDTSRLRHAGSRPASRSSKARHSRPATWATRWRRKLGRGLWRVWSFGTSQDKRSSAGRRWIARRIEDWSERRFLDSVTVRQLHGDLSESEVGGYLTDFGMHLALQLALRFCRWFVLPTALSWGLIRPAPAALFLLAGGAASRTLYTLGRSVDPFLKRRAPPWVALGVGAVPVLGNLAYPAQLLYLSRRRNGGELARFVLCEVLTSVGRAIPIWGGRDSGLEHSFGRLAATLCGMEDRRPAASGRLPSESGFT
jgi:hypothetical protein